MGESKGLGMKATRFMTWHRAHRGRMSATYLFTAGWVIISWESLDGVLIDGGSQFDVLRATSAWFVLIGGLLILGSLFYRPVSWVRMAAWGFFASGLMFWTIVATRGWPLFAFASLAGWWQVWAISGDRQKRGVRVKR